MNERATAHELLSVAGDGEPVPARQKRLDRWHEAMAQSYWHASFDPRSLEPVPPPE
jgi:hypothetical protein